MNDKTQIHDKGWTIGTLGVGCINALMIIVGIVLLNRMAAFRSTLEYPESGLFIARAQILLPMGTCLIMALWGFLSSKIHIKRKKLRIVLIIAAIIMGVACVMFSLWWYSSAYSYYAQQAGWPAM